jgi:hypothetical protein
MAKTETSPKAALYAERLIENAYVQENLANAAKSLRAAYDRASKRRVKPASDEKLYQQVRQAALSIGEAARALKAGRTKPKRRRGRRLLVVLGLGVAGAGAALAVSEELRSKLLSGGSSAGQGGEGVPAEEVPSPVSA